MKSGASVSFDGLKSTNREVRTKEIWGFDTEDDGKGTVKQISATDGKIFFHFTKRDRFIQWMTVNFSRPVVFAACNLEYDLINVFGHRFDMLDLRLKNGGLSIASARLKSSKVLFYDTLNHFPFGVKRMGEALNLPKLEMDLSGWDYVDRDALIVQRYVSEMQTRYNLLGANFNATLPSSSLDLYRRRFLPFSVQRPNDATLEYLFRGYYGGRTEVFDTSPNVGRIFYIDVNSMYPAVMTGEYPNPNVLILKKRANLDLFGVAECKVSVPKDCYFPPLPFRESKLMFPTGTFVGSWTYEELRALEERGGTIEKIFSCCEFKETCFPFRGFIEELYELKQSAPDEMQRYAAKLFMNSLYGKMGERVELTSFIPADEVPEDQTAILYGDFAYVTYGEKYPSHTNAIWAIYTTARARLLLLVHLERIRRNGGIVLYCDTDSIIYRATRPLHAESDRIGEFKLEGEFDFAHFLAPKLYALSAAGKRTVRAKGVPRDFSYRFFDEGEATFSRPLRLRSVLRRGLQSNLWIETTKHRRTPYTKRKVMADGTTIPIHYTN